MFYRVSVLLAMFASCYANAQSTGGEMRFQPVDKTRSRTVPIKVYWDTSDQAQPVILFSHGLGGSRENSSYLGKHWAAAGYVAVFMQHHGSDESVWKSAGIGQRFRALKTAASGKSLIDRASDVSFVIDQLESWNDDSTHPLGGRLNLERIGMSGHSFGAATTMAVAGRKYPFSRTYTEPRIDAFFAMSPQAGSRTDPKGAFGHLAKPILCMTGTKDKSPINSDVTPESRQDVYAALPPGDKFQLVLKDGEHHAFGDSKGRRTRNRNPAHHPAIQMISLHFWNAYLKDDPASKAWLQSNAPITSTDLTASDIWSWK